ncbi:MAG: hypothetical protein GTN56_05445 [Xanthomonadales bacterium]|nr:hypothetical protein [Xanthomonadales bacterium]NIN74604.1 hypothetical protein [Xanthomonadales bacterium]NIP11646.1 hypothetical protein [Xanthomonadales bacterium]NIT33404.1 hypothetical protein [Xanthomonadales bacterium]
MALTGVNWHPAPPCGRQWTEFSSPPFGSRFLMRVDVFNHMFFHYFLGGKFFFTLTEFQASQTQKKGV